VRSEISIGLASYYLYVSTFVFLLVAASTPDGLQSFFDPWAVLKNMTRLMYHLVTFEFTDVWNSIVLALSPAEAGIVLVGFLLACLLMIYADRRMSTVFSQFWHRHHTQLRDALKDARRIARDSASAKETMVIAYVGNNTERTPASSTEDAAHERPKEFADIV
jgi:hypothetical protein